MIQRNSASSSAPGSEPNSSPSTAWPVTSASRSRIARSTAWSASLTGVRSGLVVTFKVGGAKPRHRDRVGGVGELEREVQMRGDVHGRSIRAESPEASPTFDRGTRRAPRRYGRPRAVRP